MEISRPRIETQPLSDTRSRFVIEPLEPGFGYTLGNSMRRTLLSSIPGAAVTSIKIDGVLHEFSSIPGVKEDVTDIILNVKELRLRSETNEPATMFLRATGPVEVTGSGEMTNYDRLLLDVETDGSLSPEDALASAGGTLRELVSLFADLTGGGEGLQLGPAEQQGPLGANLDTPIEELDLSVRSYNCLKREGITTVGELVTKSEADLLDIR